MVEVISDLNTIFLLILDSKVSSVIDNKFLTDNIYSEFGSGQSLRVIVNTSSFISVVKVTGVFVSLS